VSLDLRTYPLVPTVDASDLASSELASHIASFASDSGPSGSLLLRSVPIGDLGPTPLVAHAGTGDRARIGAINLLIIAELLGHAVGYKQEHGGDIVQDLYPLMGSVGKQLSTSSGTNLAFHTETAFHPHKPRYLLLLCQRGDSSAHTTLCSADAVLTSLDAATIEVLRQPRFRTGVDLSFGPSSNWLTPPLPIFAGEPGAEEFNFDAELTNGCDGKATAALVELSTVIGQMQTSIVLEAGDLLIIDNHRAVHGRSTFTARFDGTDRWLLRTFVVEDMAAIPTTERTGAIINTTF
jgi:L-asparagine oxygenase